MKYYRVIDEKDNLIGYTSSYVEELPGQQGLPSPVERLHADMRSVNKRLKENDIDVGLEPSGLEQYDGVFDG